MACGNGIIFDMTGPKTRIGVLPQSDGQVRLVEEFAPNFRVAIAQIGNDLIALADGEAGKALDGTSTLSFDHLDICLPLVEDEELQSQIIRTFWTFLCQAVFDRRLGDNSGVTSCVIVRHNYSVPLLERFREACASDGRIRLFTFLNEAASLVIGTLNSEILQDLDAWDAFAPAVSCLIVAYDDQHAEVCCFEHCYTGQVGCRVIVHDFFRTTFADLMDELQSRKWTKAPTVAVSLESSALTEDARGLISDAAGCLSLELTRRQLRPNELLLLKMKGAACLCGLSTPSRSSSVEYDVETVLNIGLQTNSTRFHPILAKDDLTEVPRYPIASSQTFKLSGHAVDRLTLTGRAGYSDRVDDSVSLGNLTVPRREVSELSRSKQAALLAVVKLESPGRGELSIEMLPHRRVIDSRAFIIPGLMN
jgi:hypothetical protein